MSYTILEQKIKSLPEECFEEIKNFLDYLQFKLTLQEKALVSSEKIGIEDIISIAKTEPRTAPIEKWTKADIRDNRGL